MPQKNGYEVLRSIKTDPLTHMIPVVVLTTSRSRKDFDEVARLGAEGCFSKPNSIREYVVLLQRLGRFFDNKPGIGRWQWYAEMGDEDERIR